MMNPGDVRTFQRGGGNAVVLGIGLWAEKQSGWIQIHMTAEHTSHTTVTNNPDSVRHHRTLFRNLRRTLIEQGCWPFGEEGAEMEGRDSEPRYDPIPIRGKPLSETIIEDRGER